MKRSHLELAAKLWSLALVAHTDLEGNDVCDKIRSLAKKRAKTKLKNLGTDCSEIQNESDAIVVAQRLRP